MYVLFWIMYLVSVLVISNALFGIYMVRSINKKVGPTGAKGEVGDPGDVGEEADCEAGCKNKVCHIKIMKNITNAYNRLIGEKDHKVNNPYIKETIKRICHSQQFKDVSQLRHPQDILEYISDVFVRWIELLAKSDKSENHKHLKDYMEGYGGRNEWEVMTKDKNNPFREIEKYDIFYWGLNKEFYPRLIQRATQPKKKGWSPDFAKSKKKEPRIKAFKTNIYNWTYADHKTGARYNLTVYRTPPLKIGGDVYYPISSASDGKFYGNAGNSYLERLGSKVGYKYQLSTSTRGPNYGNVIVSGDKKWIRKPKPGNWSWNWNDRKTGGRYDVTFWNANDFEEDGELYRCFGNMVMRNHSWSDPSKQLGRDKVPIVCINDKALEEIPFKHNFKWSDHKSGGKYSGSVWQNNDGTYNSGYFNRGKWYPNKSRKAYRIKDEFLNPEIEDDSNFTSHDEKDYGFGYGYHERYNKKDRKGSLFDLLDLVVENDIQSHLGETLFMTHSGLDDPNSYLLKQYNQTTQNPDKCLEVKGKSVVCNPTKKPQLWEVEFLGQSHQKCLIKSKDNGRYLKSDYKYVYSVEGKLPSKKLDDPKLKPFIWTLV